MLNFMPPEEESSSQYDDEQDNDAEIVDALKDYKEPQEMIPQDEEDEPQEPLFVMQNQLDQDEIMLDFAPVTLDPPVRPQTAGPKGRSEDIKPIRMERPQTAKVKKAEDDDFGSSSEEEDMTPEQKKQRKIEQMREQAEKDKKILKEQFKEWFKPDASKIRKSNYIGDQIIVEKLDLEEEIESENEDQQDDFDDGNYKSKMNKISKLYEDSTKDFKKQQKDQGIQQMEAQIMQKAKRDQKLIDDFKKRMRDAMHSSSMPITNQLRHYSEEKIKYKIREFEQRYPDTQKIQIKADIQEEEKIEKPKKKKKKKVQQVEEIKTEIIPEEQNQLDDIQINFDEPPEVKPEPVKKKKEVKEQKIEMKKSKKQKVYNQIESKMILILSKRARYRGAKKLGMPKPNLDDSATKPIIHVQPQSIQPQSIKSQSIQQPTNTLSIHDPISYKQALEYFTQDAYISHYIQDLKPVQEKKPDAFSQMFPCFNVKAVLKNAELLHQQDQLFAISKMKLMGHETPNLSKFEASSEYTEHHQMINSIYKFLINKTPPQIGSHWQKIGFQGNDPRTDIRGCGMLGVLQILYFMEKYPETFVLLHTHSQKERVEFPLVIQMFSFTSLVLAQLRTEKLFFLCNKLKCVFTACNQAYSKILIEYMQWYIQENCTVVNMDSLNKRMKVQISKGMVEGCQWSDQQATNLLFQKKQQEQEQEEVPQAELPKKKPKKKKKEPEQQLEQIQQKVDNERKKRNYAQSEEPSKPKQQPLENNDNALIEDNEFSIF